jgi:hypothetical protein
MLSDGDVEHDGRGHEREFNVADVHSDDDDDVSVLIIEDDQPASSAPAPPVRREEYRHLFSRLRSG